MIEKLQENVRNPDSLQEHHGYHADLFIRSDNPESVKETDTEFSAGDRLPSCKTQLGRPNDSPQFLDMVACRFIASALPIAANPLASCHVHSSFMVLFSPIPSLAVERSTLSSACNSLIRILTCWAGSDGHLPTSSC